VTIVGSTFNAPPADLKGVNAPIKWVTLETRVMMSIVLGIEQARLNQGTLLTDADLATDDDE
jgi:hypothetical protein